MQNEVWVDIPSCEGLYQVSNLGRVKSLNYKNTKKEKILKQCDNNRGYLQVCIRINNRQKTPKVHTLVAMAFLGYARNGKMDFVIDHINDNKLDNRVENLRIVTQRENNRKTQGNYSSQYKGVHWSSREQKWISEITINNKKKYLGSFKSEYDAHLAYQNKLKEIEQL